MEHVLRGAPLNVDENASAWTYIKNRLELHGHRIAQVSGCSEEETTFITILHRARAVCKWLRSLGLTRGRDVIVIKAANTLHLAPILLGAWQAGLACALVNSNSTQRELSHACDIARPSLILGVEPENVILHGHESIELADQLANILRDTSDNNSQHEEDFGRGSDVALILGSSGSTGLPKGVVLSHQNVVAALKNSKEYAGDKDNVSLCVLPFFHAFGLVLMLMCLCEGACLVILPRFSLTPFLKTTRKYQVTTLYLVPSLLRLLSRALEQDPEETREALCSVRCMWTGAAAIRAELQETVRSSLPGNPIMCHSYGLTETTFTVLGGPSISAKPGSPGKLTPGVECKVISLEGKALGPGEIGELLIRGPSVTTGYLRNEVATCNAIDPEGWFHTGDLCHYDADGYFFMLDRAKEIIKYHAHQVSPSELEGVLCSLSGVAEAAVIGVKDPICGELPAALVVQHPDGPEITEQQIHDHVESQVCAYKQLRGGIIFVKELPKTASGKILRRKARILCLPKGE